MSDGNPLIAKWMSDEIDRCVLEKLIEKARQITLRKKLYGKPTRKGRKKKICL